MISLFFQKMKTLKYLFNKLNDLEFCRYSEKGKYPVEKDEQIIMLSVDELLEIGQSFPYREHMLIANFETENKLRILYCGENAFSMKKNIDNLKLPKSYPSNLGEKVFYIFRDYLEDINSGSISLEQQVASGKEHQLEFVLRKLIEIYKNNQKNYAASKKESSGEILN